MPLPHPFISKDGIQMTHTHSFLNKQMMSHPQSLNTLDIQVEGERMGGAPLFVPDVITYVSGSGSFSFWDFCGP